MLIPQELLPGFVRFFNVAFRHHQGRESTVSFEEARQDFYAFLLDTKGRLAWELPLLCSFVNGTDLAEELATTFEDFERRVASVTIDTAIEDLTPALDGLLEKFRLASALKAELPVFTDIKVMNELLLLASAHLDGRVDKNPLGQRLPLLFDWVERHETDWQTYLRLFPDQLYRVRKVQALFEVMRRVVGGIQTYLDDSDPEDLKTALKVGVQTFELMVAATETRALTEAERVEFSPDLHLERAWRGADWADWSGTSLASGLLTFYQQAQRQIALLAKATLMPATIIQEVNPVLEALSLRLVEAFDILWHRRTLTCEVVPRQARAAALAELESCRKELQQVQNDVEEAAEPYKILLRLPIYRQLVAVLDGVLKEIVPDAVVDGVAQSLEQGRTRFQDVIERAADSLAAGRGLDGGQQADIAGLVSSLSERFALPGSKTEAEFVFDEGYEVTQVVVGGAEDPEDALPDGSADLSVEADGGPREDGVALESDLDSVWEALQAQGQALECLDAYLHSGDPFALYQAFEFFAEPLFNLEPWAPTITEKVADKENHACPYCGEQVPGGSDRCPGCKRLLSFEDVTSTLNIARDGENLTTSSPVLSVLDADTMNALGAAVIPPSIVERWEDLAVKLEGMGRAAASESRKHDLTRVVTRLVEGCRRVKSVLLTDGGSYEALRRKLFADFDRLEELGKPRN